MENRYYVYQLRLENSDLPFYIGKGTGYRAQSHLQPSSLKYKSHKNHVIMKALEEHIEVKIEILQDHMSEEDAFAMEAELIKKFGRSDIGTGILTNHSEGGSVGPVGYKPSEATISLSIQRRLDSPNLAKGLASASESMKRKWTEPGYRERVVSTMYGRIVSEETRAKIGAANSIALRGKKQSQETISKRVASIKANNRKNVHSEETKKKISLIKKGCQYPHKWTVAYEYASEMYDEYSKTGTTRVTRNKYGLSHNQIRNIIDKLKSGWNPSEDPVWIGWFEERN